MDGRKRKRRLKNELIWQADIIITSYKEDRKNVGDKII